MNGKRVENSTEFAYNNRGSLGRDVVNQGEGV